MITGDQSRTAAAIGAELGLSHGGALNVIEATRLADLPPAELARAAERAQVFARVSPSQKLEIVQALQRAGRVVAMTGDGINDGPALRTADVGVAMGSSGTEVARSVADVVLEDDELASLLIAVRHGRATYDNLRKSIHFLLATNLSEIEVMLACALAGVEPPLNPMQLLWINLVSDIFPGLALAMDPPEPDVLERPPRDPAQPIVGRAEAKRLALQASFISAGALGVYGAVSAAGGVRRGGSAAFMTLTCGQLLHALSARSERHGLFNPGGLRANPLLAAATGGSLALQLVASVAPWLRRLLGLQPLNVTELGVCTAGALLPFVANEALKLRSARR
jgi:Ca2+-transporting ATPase